MLDFAERKARARKARNIKFQQMDAQNLEFEDASFDVVGCSLAIFYLPDIPGALQGMLRVLKPGGQIGIATADAADAFTPLSEVYMAQLRRAAKESGVQVPSYSTESEMTRTKEGLEKLLTDAGFVDVHLYEEQIPTRFSSPDDWWTYGRGSTWGELVLDAMTEEERASFSREHLNEIQGYFKEDGVKTETPVVIATARKPE
jgi:SAM-dependent methyltransferase